jgi:AraC-like DNA-binding protein
LKILLLIAAVIGFVLTSLLFSKKTSHTKASFFLGFFYFIISVYALQTYLIDTNQIKSYSWFFVWPLMLYHLIPVPIYFYFVTVIKDEFHWKNSYLILFVPFFLGVVDVASVYAAPKDVFNQYLNMAARSTENRFESQYWLLSLNEHYLIRHFWQLATLIVIFPELRFFLREGAADKLKLALNKWMVFFWSLLVALSLIAILHGIEHLFNFSAFNYIFGLQNGSVLVTFILYFTAFIIGIIPIYFPTILQGYPRVKKAQAPIGENSKQSDDLKFSLNETEIKIRLKKLIENKIYLDQDFTVTTCARHMDMPAHHLSYFISNYFGQNFSSYKNNLRIDYSKHLIDDGFLENNTIDTLAITCGFGNRSSFSKIFKTITNQSPSEYLPKVK